MIAAIKYTVAVLSSVATAMSVCAVVLIITIAINGPVYHCGDHILHSRICCVDLSLRYVWHCLGIGQLNISCYIAPSVSPLLPRPMESAHYLVVSLVLLWPAGVFAQGAGAAVLCRVATRSMRAEYRTARRIAERWIVGSVVRWAVLRPMLFIALVLLLGYCDLLLRRAVGPWPPTLYNPEVCYNPVSLGPSVAQMCESAVLWGPALVLSLTDSIVLACVLRVRALDRRQCISCGYLRAGRASAMCPECGFHDPEDEQMVMASEATQTLSAAPKCCSC